MTDRPGPEARSRYKRTRAWIGYTVQLTETCDAGGPHLVTDVQTMTATTPDREQLPAIHRALAGRGLLPREHLVDAGYPDAEILASSRAEHEVAVVGPVPPDCQWQAQADAGFDVSCFTIEWDERRAVCPAGRRSVRWVLSTDNRGKDMISIQFAGPDCRACLHRAACTTARAGRRLGVRPKEHHLALQEARRFQTTPAFKERYVARAGVEGTVSQASACATCATRAYVGLAKTRLQHVPTAAALNLVRVAHWIEDPRLARTRRAPFLALLPEAA